MEIRNIFAVSVNAEAAMRDIRLDIPGWNPMLEVGFQGRQVMLFIDVEADGEAKTSLFAVGNDGEVRRACEVVEQWIRDGSAAIPGASTGAIARWQTMVDFALSDAMPWSVLDGIDATLVFRFKGGDLPHDRANRLATYRAGCITPRQLHAALEVQEREWRVAFGLTPVARLYAMCEVEGGHAIGTCLAIRPGYAGGPDVGLISEAWADWNGESKIGIAA